jgi:hypothetical protein
VKKSNNKYRALAKNNASIKRAEAVAEAAIAAVAAAVFRGRSFYVAAIPEGERLARGEEATQEAGRGGQAG